ncbi:MAG: hypothetical protein IJU40_09070 [Desulfovibrionaceae bacterium]|nr:hypothetical protein [Desulfovibrionaceae bacterium]
MENVDFENFLNTLEPLNLDALELDLNLDSLEPINLSLDSLKNETLESKKHGKIL